MSEKSPEETLMTTWSYAQQKMLVGWLNLLQGTEQPSRKMVWSETVKAWQSTVQETLDTQARWLRDWTGRVQVTSGSPTDLRKNVTGAGAAPALDRSPTAPLAGLVPSHPATWATP